MPPEFPLHTRNGHRHEADKSELSPGEIIGLVHSDRPTSPAATSDLLRVAQMGEAEKATEAPAGTEAAFDRGRLADVQATLDGLEAQAEAPARMVTQLVTTARRRRRSYRPETRRGLVNLNEITPVALAIAAPSLGHVRVECCLDASLPWIVGDCRQLQRAVAGLVRSMAQLMAGADIQGRIIVATARQDSVLHGESVARLCISAERAAIPDDVIGRLFCASSSLWAAGKVTEMDLYVAPRIVGEHGGVVSAEILPEGDPSFTLEFPAI